MTLALAITTALTATVGELAPAIKNLAGLCPKRPHQPEETAIHFTVDDGELTLRQYNQECLAEITIPATTGDADYSFSLAGPKLNATLTKLIGRRTAAINAASLPLTLRNDRVIIDYDDIEIDMPTAQWWNQLPEMTPRGVLGTFTAQTVRSAWNQVKNALSTNDMKPIFCGLNLILQENSALFTAADDYRVARREIDFTATHPTGDLGPNIDTRRGMIIPADSMKMLVDWLPKDDTPVTLSISGADGNVFLRFSFGNAHLSTRLFAGNYPDIPAVLPATSNQRMTFDRQDLEAKLRKIANQVAANSTVDLQFDGDAATLRAGLHDDGSATITAPISVTISETITPTLRFDISNLIDAIKTLDTPEVILAADVQAAKVSCKVQVFPGDTVFDSDSGQSPMPQTNNLHLLVSRGI